MKEVGENLLGAGLVGCMLGAAAATTIWGGRFITKIPQLPYTNALGTAGGFFVSSFLAQQLLTDEMISDNVRTLLFLVGGIGLSTAANKYWGGKELSVLSSAATPIVSLIIIILGVIFSKSEHENKRR